jgi:hypothetical protein
MPKHSLQALPCPSLFCPADRLPSGAAAKARLVYQDSDGDWLLLQPQAPWQVFTRTVRKLVVTCK